jgi:hypothetical protein
MNRTHVFLALDDGHFGERIYAARLAAQLERAGDRVIFAAAPPDADYVDFTRRLVNRSGCDALVLVDVAGAYAQLERAGADAGFVDAIGAPVLGLDVWDLDCTNMLMERGTAGFIVSRHARDVTRRLIPSPMIRPSGWRDPLSAGVYDSLPESVAPAASREELRARLGVGERERLIVLPTAPWQHRAPIEDPYVARSMARLPSLLASHLARLGSDARVAHVGPARLPHLASRLGQRYRWHPPPPPRELPALLAAADLMLTLNVTSPNIALAAQLGVPVLLAHNSFTVTSDDALPPLPFSPTETTRAWLRTMTPLHPFAVWPLGLARFTAPIVQDNACVEMTRRSEILDEEGFVAAAQSLLGDEAARAAARLAMSRCLEAVRRLPRAVDVVTHHLMVE